MLETVNDQQYLRRKVKFKPGCASPDFSSVEAAVELSTFAGNGLVGLGGGKGSRIFSLFSTGLVGTETEIKQVQTVTASFKFKSQLDIKIVMMLRKDIKC